MEIKDVNLKKGTGSLQHEAIALYRKLELPGFEQATRITARSGNIGWRCAKTNRIMVAKKSPYGDIVSIHKGLWDHTVSHKVEVVMYVKSSGYFYLFKPWTIVDIELNKRGEETMVNFSIRNGMNMHKAVAMEQEIEKEAKKNEDYQQKLL